MKKILLIDNYDSFTYNLVQYFQMLGAEVLVKRNDEITPEQAQALAPEALVFSPGPGTVENPEDIGISEALFHDFRGKIPILGVCLGHQMIGKIFGGTIETIAPQHGKRWPMKITTPDNILFEGLPEAFEGMRYHSMVVSRTDFPKDQLTITAETEDTQHIMAFEKRDEKIFGLQFHPESIGTKTGLKMLGNFLGQ